MTQRTVTPRTTTQPTATQPTATQPTATQPTATQPTATQPTATQRRHDAARRRWLSTASALAAIAAAPAARAQSAGSSWPTRPVKLIVPFAAGGGPDLQARKLAPELARALGVNVVVENRVGAAGIVAAEVAAQQPPDGYTALMGSVTHVINKAMNPAVRFDPLKSFDPVTLTSNSGTVLVVPKDAPYRSAQDLVDAIRSRPGALNYGSGGIGTAAHLAGATFCSVLGLQAVHVPYRGSVELVPALQGGQIQFALPISGTAMVGIAQDKVRPLATSTTRRMRQLPEIPTLAELFKSELLVQESWGGVWVPAGTPAAIIAKLDAAVKAGMRDPAVREFHETGGSDVVLSESPVEFGRFIAAETTKWTDIIKLTGVKPE
ncbi:MAG: Bug family tripartite tricarboxylate transporter substrate binding protein [Lautropia sp.]